MATPTSAAGARGIDGATSEGIGGIRHGRARWRTVSRRGQSMEFIVQNMLFHLEERSCQRSTTTTCATSRSRSCVPCSVATTSRSSSARARSTTCCPVWRRTVSMSCPPTSRPGASLSQPPAARAAGRHARADRIQCKPATGHDRDRRWAGRAVAAGQPSGASLMSITSARPSLLAALPVPVARRATPSGSIGLRNVRSNVRMQRVRSA